MLVFSILTIAILVGLQNGHRLATTANQPQPQANHQTEKPGPNKSPLTQPGPPQMQFGWLTFIAKPLYLALQLLYNHSVHNWGWSIILLTALFNTVQLWPRIMSIKSSLKMMRIQPKIDAIRKSYADLKLNDSKRITLNNEIAALYKAEGANMYGGCLPMLLQMPLLFAYQRVLHNAAELHNAHWLWLRDLSLPDPIHVLPILIIGSMCLTQFITPSPGMDPRQRQILAVLMPLIMGFTLWHYASGLALYWITCNLFNLTLQLSINRTKMGKEMRTIAVQRATK